MSDVSDEPPQGNWRGDDSPCDNCQFAHRVQNGNPSSPYRTWLECSSKDMVAIYKPRITEDRRIGITVDCVTAYRSCRGTRFERLMPAVYDFENNPPVLGWLDAQAIRKSWTQG